MSGSSKEPQSNELKELEQTAKKWVNEIRKKNGKRALGKLKRGVPKSKAACTIAMSVPFHSESWMQHGLPQEIWAFIEAYDKGRYPHLEIPKTPIKIKRPGQRKAEVIG